MTTVFMENPHGYALDALALIRQDPRIREKPYGPEIYRFFWGPSRMESGWIANPDEYTAANYPDYVRKAVKRIVVGFRTASQWGYVTYDPDAATLQGLIESTAFERVSPSHHNFIKVEVPSQGIPTDGDPIGTLIAQRPDLDIGNVSAGDGNYRAVVSLNPDRWTPLQVRFSAGLFSESGQTIANTGESKTLYAVGPSGRVSHAPRSSGNVESRLPSEAEIADYAQRERNRYRDRVLSRMRAIPKNDEFEVKRREHREKTAANYVNYRNKGEKITEMLIPTLPFVGHGLASSRRWGIEIETGAGRDISAIPAEWDSKGDGSLESAYDGGYRYIEPEDCDNSYYHSLDTDDDDYVSPDYCEECGDVEVYDGYDSDDCVEVVSPILSSMHSKGLESLCRDLEFAPRTESAGIHVHVEAKDLSVGQIRELLMSYDHVERFIEASYDRVQRGYCKRRSPQELLDIVRSAADKPTQAVRDLPKGDRYVTVNLRALDFHGTVEFRAMGPKYNYDHLVRWAMFCREMVNCAANGATSKMFANARKWEDVLAIFAKYGSEYKKAIIAEMQEDARQPELVEV